MRFSELGWGRKIAALILFFALMGLVSVTVQWIVYDVLPEWAAVALGTGFIGFALGGITAEYLIRHGQL